MTFDELTPDLRIEIQDNMIFRHNAKTRRERWEMVKMNQPVIKAKRYSMGGELIEDDGSRRLTTFKEDRTARVA